MATQTDPIAALDSVKIALSDATLRADAAEKERDEAKKAADALQKEKDEHWKTQIKEAKKMHPGQEKLLKMFMAATHDEWVEVKDFLAMFDGHLPVGMVRIAQGTDALLNGADPSAKK